MLLRLKSDSVAQATPEYLDVVSFVEKVKNKMVDLRSPKINCDHHEMLIVAQVQ